MNMDKKELKIHRLALKLIEKGLNFTQATIEVEEVSDRGRQQVESILSMCCNSK
jgi:hypothetical protein